jgi:hypothetical protein
MTTTTHTQFGVGTVLSQALSVFLANLVPFCVLALIVMLPWLLYSLAATGDPTAGFSASGLLAIVIQMILGQLMAASIAYGSFQYLRGQPVTMGDALSRGLSLILPVIGVAILCGLIIGIGMILLVVPGVIAAVMLWVAIPVAVVERPGVVDSLKRSADLTKGNRWNVFGVVLIIGIIGWVVGFILGFILLSAAGFTVYSVAIWISQAIFGAFNATAAAVGYYSLRSAKEGIDIGTIARVFD